MGKLVTEKEAKISKIQFNFYISVFDELNKIFDACKMDCVNRIEKARMEAHDLLDQKSDASKKEKKTYGLV